MYLTAIEKKIATELYAIANADPNVWKEEISLLDYYMQEHSPTTFTSPWQRTLIDGTIVNIGTQLQIIELVRDGYFINALVELFGRLNKANLTQTFQIQGHPGIQVNYFSIAGGNAVSGKEIKDLINKHLIKNIYLSSEFKRFIENDFLTDAEIEEKKSRDVIIRTYNWSRYAVAITLFTTLISIAEAVHISNQTSRVNVEKVNIAEIGKITMPICQSLDSLKFELKDIKNAVIANSNEMIMINKKLQSHDSQNH